MTDRFGRRFPYLRLSITDVCNFRCNYCLPQGYRGKPNQTFLSVDEIRRIGAAFARLGTGKIRLTGGEPTLRSDFIDIVAALKSIPGIERLALTTNGYRLPERIDSYHSAGIDAINVSIDSLNRQRFTEITGHDRLEELLAGINRAIHIGMDSIKINTVLLRNMNDSELNQFLDYVSARPIVWRFIELMRTGENQMFFRQNHLSAQPIAQQLLQRGWRKQSRAANDGPALEYQHPDSRGRIGLITPYAKTFCDTCNRLRISSSGDLQLCLFGERGHSLRSLLRHDYQCDQLQERLMTLMRFKPSRHFLAEGDSGHTPHLASIGG